MEGVTELAGGEAIELEGTGDGLGELGGTGELEGTAMRVAGGVMLDLLG